MIKHDFKKKYGQNFLNNDKILDDISNSFCMKDNSMIVEVGAGSGVLTKKLITKNVPVISFEIDESLKEYLNKISCDNLNVVYRDFLSINLKDYLDSDKHIYFVANVPYYITTPIISKFIDENIIPDVMVMMVQKEVAERFMALPQSKEYGYFTVFLNYFYTIELVTYVSRNCFNPAPKVDSAVIKLIPKENVLIDYQQYFEFLKQAFKMKRKKLMKNIKMDILSSY